MKYYIITIGCQMNKSDSERVASCLEDKGYRRSSQRKEADLVVVNTCGVRQSAEDRVYGLIPELKKENPGARIVLTGCLSARKDVQRRLKDKIDIWLPIKELPSLGVKLESAENKYKEPDGNEYLRIKPKLSSSFSSFIPIGNGCNNFCSYCVVPYARGREVYRPGEEVLKEAEDIISKGYKELTLIAQNVNSYTSSVSDTEEIKKYIPGLSSSVIDFADLLQAVSQIKKDIWIRFATSHPKDMSDKLIKVIAENKNICRHIHLPAQAGDDMILERMNRKYKAKHYRSLVDKIRRHIPGVSITTDIIVGFPGESKEQFSNTADLFKDMSFDMAYISQYSPRPQTAAASMRDDVPQGEKRAREEELMRILKETAYENNKQYIGREVDVLVEGCNKKGEYYGKTDTNKNVKIQIEGHGVVEKGEFVKVVVDKIQDFGLSGYIKKP
jgi:tRNA-2-methylthio-N6-dimethylallyladenosine synthase